ncbi:MAG: hypothetical protein G01um10148_606 [Parcubacteria group bacterium Gr01-1014_8]|nr:MAG: hypothetical protein G01um10148_606 [Parcubacteria group bacterium Gr01-1014_8]
MRSLYATLTLIVLVSFTLHLAWESWHVHLYTGYESWTLGMPVVLMATIGDVLYTLGAFALVSGIRRSLDWIHEMRMSDYLALVALGFLIALFVEYKGLALDRWQYLPEMPIIPILGVAVSPILQMSLLLPATLFIVSRFVKR